MVTYTDVGPTTFKVTGAGTLVQPCLDPQEGAKKVQTFKLRWIVQHIVISYFLLMVSFMVTSNSK